MYEFLELNSINVNDNIYFLEEYKESEFEKYYIALRTKEDRVYNDSVVTKFPNYDDKDSHLFEEWKIRKKSSKRLKKYLVENYRKSTILEVGCGNGWLCHYLSTMDNSVFGLDINIKELNQASRLFYKKNKIQFIFGDLFMINFPKNSFDIIVLASSIQYFTNISDLIKKCLNTLKENGEIHIVDSNIYLSNEVESARKRSKEYYNKIGFPRMIDFYFHPSIEDFTIFNYEMIYNPVSSMQKIRKMITKNDFVPFPWIKIRNN